MKKWYRRAELTAGNDGVQTEHWELWNDTVLLDSLPVRVEMGKPLDVLSLKNASIDETNQYIEFLQNAVKNLYGPGADVVEVGQCPCCGFNTDFSNSVIRIYDVDYRMCDSCKHVYVGTQPRNQDLDNLFKESEGHSTTYVDASSLEVRMEQVIEPKIRWVFNAYQEEYGKFPDSGLDIGAGGGHFVEGLKRRGVRAEGFELSRSSRNFAAGTFNILLRDDDFLSVKPEPGAYDLITFWGLLEYTSDPNKFIQAAREWLPLKGMLVVEVPRFDSLSTEIQRSFPNSVARHLDPTSHINCFSDTSLVDSLYRNGFQPVAAWYFGMDFYETLIQFSIHFSTEMISRFASVIQSVQSGLDRAKFCDDLVVAAVPHIN